MGLGIKDSGVPRGDIFITSKLWNTHHPNVKEGLQRTLDALGTDYLDLYVWNTSRPNSSAELIYASAGALACSVGPGEHARSTSLCLPPLTTMQNETSELLPVNPDGSRSVDRSWDQSETWRQMEEVFKSGKVKAIGVANWSIIYLEELRKKWTVVPAVNQVELHPFLPQHDLKKYCDDLGILLEAYSPLGSTGMSYQCPETARLC